ncbi:MAG: acyltransferase [Deltaproteobacteria bacterium]|nr:acyltransferase [Deltaproteobacteria bacterium]
MLSFLPGIIRGILALIMVTLNIMVLCTTLFFIAFLKLIIPFKFWRKLCDTTLIFISTTWVRNNALITKLMHRINWEVEGVETLDKNEWYIVISNHQTWVDIPVLQTIFLGRIPFLKFFLKKELIWVPMLGISWWALDFPFMKRYSQEFLRKYPHLKGKDIEITRKACQKFKTKPVAVMNFMEGTRFTKTKKEKQNSPYKHLLKPKAGGIAFVFSSMGEHLNSIVDVTIAYPEGIRNFWEFMCGKVTHIKVRVQTRPITQDLLGDYFNDPVFRENFQIWVNELWEKKDNEIGEMLLHNPEVRSEPFPKAVASEYPQKACGG